MIHIQGKIHLSPYQAMAVLQQHTDEFGVFIDVDRALDYQAHYSVKRMALMPEYFSLIGRTDIGVSQTEKLRDLIISRFNLDPYLFMKGEKLSMDKVVRESIISNPTVDEEVRVLMKIIDELSLYNQRISSMSQYLDRPMSVEESFEGHRMTLVKPTWNMLATNRFSASDPSLQNLNRDFGDLITFPKGYQLVYADSGQIEPRIMFSKYIYDPLLKYLIELYNDAYFGQLHYILLSDEDYAKGQEDPTFIEKQDFDKELRNDLKTLGLAGAYGSKNLDKINRDLSYGYNKRIVNHPKRAEWETQAQEEVRQGAETFYTAFGTPMTPKDKAKYQRGSKGWFNHLVRCAINNPQQGTAADLMCESIYVADKILRNDCKGYARIAAYIHDAGLFYVPENDLANVSDKLIGCLAYQVDDWIPIYSEGGIGKKPGMKDVPVI